MSDNFFFHTIQFILTQLFDHEIKHLDKRQAIIIEQHIARGGTPDGFRHMGLIYSPHKGGIRKQGKYGPIHESLATEMSAILTERKRLEADRDRISQALVLVLQDCKCPADRRDALPNSLVSLFPDLNRLERTRPEAYTLADNPKAHYQYMTIRDKIDFYVASRMLY